MKRLLVLGAALLGLSGCVSDYPVYDDYPVYERPRPRLYEARPVVVYEDRYRPRPVYRDPSWRDDRRYGRYERPRIREDDRRFYDRPVRPRYDRPVPPPPRYDRPERPERIARSPPVYDRRLDPPPPPQAAGEQPPIDVGRAFGGRAVEGPASGPRPYIPPRPAG